MSRPVVHIDTETRSAVDLRKAGMHRYFEDPTTAVWCLVWAIGEGPRTPWLPGDPDPDELLDAVRAGATVVAHNNNFDREAWNKKLPAHWPKLTIEQSDCTMARCAALALPQGLDDAAAVLGLPVRKDPAAHRLVMQMCKPKDWVICTEDDAQGTVPVWHDDPAKIQALVRTRCVPDVEMEYLVDKRLPTLTASERRVWELDQRINERGVAFDTAFARRAAALCAEARARADREMFRLTKGVVEKTTQVGRLSDWLNERGVICSSLKKGEIEELIVRALDENDHDAVAAIRLRRASAKSSTAKYTAINNAVCADGRVRGLLNYHTTHTGRWGGRLVQPQNFPRLKDENRDLVPGDRP
jgi:DNA polymerase